MSLAFAAVCLSLFFSWRIIKSGAYWGKRRAYLLIFCSFLFFSSVFWASSIFFPILERFWDGRPYSADIVTDAVSLKLPFETETTLRFRVTNTGSKVWEGTDPTNAVSLSWHVLSASGTLIRFDNARIALPLPIPYGSTAQAVVSINPAHERLAEGKYIFEFDLVKENAFWFADKGSAPLRVAVEVTR